MIDYLKTMLGLHLGFEYYCVIQKGCHKKDNSSSARR